LAAASGLTIPLQITLSEIKLSAFIIVVFSKQKGLTLVFRNDPLESLKVSSTFDSIQFVRDYLQKTIEVKLRDLMMDELPAIIHRLSLRLWCPDQVPKEDEEVKEDEKELTLNPLSSPPLDPVDASGHLLDANEISSLSLDGGPEMQSLFSQKNLLRLSSLTTSHFTSSIGYPLVREVIFRAWAGQSDRFDSTNTPSTPSLARSQSYQGNSHTYTFSDNDSQYSGLIPSRSSMVNLSYATTGLSLGSGRHTKAGRKKKTRVVNLRRKTVSEVSSEAGDSTSDAPSVEGPVSEPIMPIREQAEEVMDALTTSNKVRFRPLVDASATPRRSSIDMNHLGVPISATEPKDVPIRYDEHIRKAESPEKQEQEPVDSKRRRDGPQSDTSSVILEQAWIMKMAGEIARRVYEEKHRNPAFWEEQSDAPPAYAPN
jgi:mitochondrial distribution and morphology protein 34